MQRFEIQRADLTAAKVVSNALKHYLNFEWNGVEHAISTLLAHNRIDGQTAQHVLDNSHRFTLCPQPRYFDARWHLEDD